MEEVMNVGFDEFIRAIPPEEIYKDEVVVSELSGWARNEKEKDRLPIRLDAYTVILIVKGEATVTMDYLPYHLKQNMVLEMTSRHLLNYANSSHDLKGYILVFAKTVFRKVFMELFTIPKEYVIHKRLSPMQKLDVADFQKLADIIERLRTNIRRKDHSFYRDIVMNEVGNFIMEIVDMSMRKINAIKNDYTISHYEELALRFMRLVSERIKEWHEVSEYSTELCVTPVYLSRTMKSLSGKTAMDWINEARVAEAKILLRRPDMSVQDTSEELNFSDQSSFGKFFKKHTGMSPLEYKRNF